MGSTNNNGIAAKLESVILCMCFLFPPTSFKLWTDFLNNPTARVSVEYLRLVLGELVPQVVSDAQLDLEIDITFVHFNRLSESLILSYDSKLRTYMTEVYIEEDEEELVSHHSRLLYKTAQLFIDRITSADMVAAMPREIRYCKDVMACADR